MDGLLMEYFHFFFQMKLGIIRPSIDLAMTCSTKSFQEDKQWRKVLYEQQRFPDNYVDRSFLEAMKTNGEITVIIFPSSLAILKLSFYSCPVEIPTRFILLDWNSVQQFDLQLIYNSDSFHSHFTSCIATWNQTGSDFTLLLFPSWNESEFIARVWLETIVVS